MTNQDAPSMIEVVARALCRASIVMQGQNEVDYATLGKDIDRNWRDHVPEARAAIDAMREPTEEMLAAAEREWDGRMSFRSTGAWQAMIDAALSGEAGQ